MTTREQKIIDYLLSNPESSSKQIHENIDTETGYSTLKRALSRLLESNFIVSEGNGKATRYSIGPTYNLNRSIDIDLYFQKEVDERQINTHYNYELIDGILNDVSIFSDTEMEQLESLQFLFEKNTSTLSDGQKTKELQRFAIDLSWKSSQIEGNTYSLLETERLLIEKETAEGKTKDEAIMLLNHKSALDFIFSNRDYLDPISISSIEDIHSILIQELDVDRNIRTRRVGISGTNYQPLDNEFQIREALFDMCRIINRRENAFEKAFLALVLLSYIQAFNDGNKRTARIVCNAILINNGLCPISFRTVDSLTYKKAMLIFYEQNNLSAMKNIFIEQYRFAVNTYF